MQIVSRLEYNSRYWRMTSSVTFPDVVEKNPRAQNSVPQYRLRNSGNSICTCRDERALICCIKVENANFSLRRPIHDQSPP